MRVLLFTGKGGAGTTTCAAATAAHVAAAGSKTLLLATDSGSLSDVCGLALGGQPLEIAANLYAAQVDTQRGLERGWADVGAHLSAVAAATAADPIDTAEIAALPGTHEVMALLELGAQAGSGRWDVLVVDCGPFSSALRMLALPTNLTWYVERLLPMPRGARHLATQRPAGQDVTRTPRALAFDAVSRLHGQLVAVRDLLTEPSTTSVRLVVGPRAPAVTEARRALTCLSLHGYAVDAVLVNRVGNVADRQEADRQAEQLQRIDASFPAQAVSRTGELPGEHVGAEGLAEFGTALVDAADPLACRGAVPAHRVDPHTDGRFILSLALPLAERGEIDLVRRGDELVVTVQGQRRMMTLPGVLRRCDIEDACLAPGRLEITFRPDPDQWLRT